MPANESGKFSTIALWVLRIVLALAFFAAGGAKLASVPMMVDLFEQIGVGQWFRILTGTLEIVGAIALVLPRVSYLGALLLAAIMTCAIATHFLVIGGSPVPAVVLLVLALVALALQRDRFSQAYSHR